jgi:hypothetical protein
LKIICTFVEQAQKKFAPIEKELSSFKPKALKNTGTGSGIRDPEKS